MKDYYDTRRASASLREAASFLRIFHGGNTDKLADRCEREALALERAIGYTGGSADQERMAAKV